VGDVCTRKRGEKSKKNRRGGPTRELWNSKAKKSCGPILKAVQSKHKRLIEKKLLEGLIFAYEKRVGANKKGGGCPELKEYCITEIKGVSEKCQGARLIYWESNKTDKDLIRPGWVERTG